MPSQYIEIAKSWARHFISGFISIITFVITTNLAKGVIPPITIDDATNALWSAAGATLVVVANYLNPNYKNYGKVK